MQFRGRDSGSKLHPGCCFERAVSDRATALQRPDVSRIWSGTAIHCTSQQRLQIRLCQSGQFDDRASVNQRHVYLRRLSFRRRASSAASARRQCAANRFADPKLCALSRSQPGHHHRSDCIFDSGHRNPMSGRCSSAVFHDGDARRLAGLRYRGPDVCPHHSGNDYSAVSESGQQSNQCWNRELLSA